MATNLERARFNMIEQQVRAWEVLDPRVLDVMHELPRESFAPGRHRRMAFSDLRIPLGNGQVMLKPIEEGRVLQSLALTGTERVLEIGAGSGFLAACLGRLAGEVESLEILPELAESATERLADADVDNVRVVHADALAADYPQASFDAVVVSGSVAEVPRMFSRWVAEGGRLFAVRGASPVMEAVCMTRVAGDHWHTDSLFETDLPRLLGAEDAPRFQF